jgi:hypothetical protein
MLIIEQMIDYKNGKIYRIVCHTTNKIYIGSTTKKHLSQRLSKHKADYKRFVIGKSKACTSSRVVLENNNYSMELIELVPCESKSELTLREAYYIRTIECVNKRIPHRTYEEYHQANKEYYQEKQKEYYHKNKEIVSEKQKEYYQKNKEKMNQKIECECGVVIYKRHIIQHTKTKRHQKYLQES